MNPNRPLIFLSDFSNVLYAKIQDFFKFKVSESITTKNSLPKNFILQLLLRKVKNYKKALQSTISRNRQSFKVEFFCKNQQIIRDFFIYIGRPLFAATSPNEDTSARQHGQTRNRASDTFVTFTLHKNLYILNSIQSRVVYLI